METQELVKALDSLEKNALSELQKIGTQQLEFADRIHKLEQRSAGVPAGPHTKHAATLGSAIAAEAERNFELFRKTRNVSFEVKTITGAAVGAVGSMPPALASGNAGGIASVLRMEPSVGVNALIYARRTGTTGAVDVQGGEGAAKATAEPVFTPINQTQIFIAGKCKITEQAIRSQGELQQVIDTFLQGEIAKRLDALMVDGSVAPAPVWTGLEALASNFTSATYTKLADACMEAQASMRLSGYAADTVVMAADEWVKIILEKTAAGEYLSGSYLREMPALLNGMRVATITAGILPANKALVYDSRFVDARVSDVMNVQMAYSGDDFDKNLITIRGEMAVIPVMRDVFAATLVTPKP